MKKRIAFIVVVVMTTASFAFGAGRTYQVTGPIVSVTDNAIVVEKGNEQWEIARDANTKVTGELKVGVKVTIEYRMIATTVTVKDAKAAAEKKK